MTLICFPNRASLVSHEDCLFVSGAMKTRNENVNHPLTIREVQVLREIGNGLPYKAIADNLGCALKTVDKHSQNIRSKLGLHCIADLVRYAFRAGIVSLFLVSFTALAELSITLAWDRNPEPDIAFYTIYYGNSPGSYGNCTNAGNNTNVIVKGLAEGVPWYFVATASNTSGLESDFSNEVSYNPPVYSITATFETSFSPFGPWSVVTQFNATVFPVSTHQFFRSRVIISK